MAATELYQIIDINKQFYIKTTEEYSTLAPYFNLKRFRDKSFINNLIMKPDLF